MRRFLLFAGLVAATLVLAAPASSARPEVFRVSFDDVDAEEAEFVSDYCGFPIEVDASGQAVVHIFDGGRMVEVDSYSIRATYLNPANGKTFKFRDAGPDRFYLNDGTLYLAGTGRSSLTNVIGVVVIDLDTGDVVFMAGNDSKLSYPDGVCAALT